MMRTSLRGLEALHVKEEIIYDDEEHIESLKRRLKRKLLIKVGDFVRVHHFRRYNEDIGYLEASIDFTFIKDEAFERTEALYKEYSKSYLRYFNKVDSFKRSNILKRVWKAIRNDL